jgi:ubiquinone/menaquinone biosynthesis C-methylase UbiE
MKQQLIALARRLGAIDTLDNARFVWDRRRREAANQAFRMANPSFVLPPDELIYETISGVAFADYHDLGKAWAQDFHRLIASHVTSPEGLAVCEWGCGAGRIIRHFVNLAGVARMTGMDYDARMIDWCSHALPGITFVQNDLMPPSRFGNGEFDAAYCFSVFTHLSEVAHHAWFDEIARIVRPGGVFAFTTMGDACAVRLLPGERTGFDAGDLVTRTAKREGSRTYVAYESAAFVRRMVGEREILAHIPPPAGVVNQDIWLVRI